MFRQSSQCGLLQGKVPEQDSFMEMSSHGNKNV